jgi:hypothetical protein
MLGIFYVAEQLFTSEEELRSIELIILVEVVEVLSSLLSNTLDPLALPQCARFNDC